MLNLVGAMPKPQNKDKIKLLSPNLFPVVGVGASAGGLEAFKRLVKAIPEDSGMAFILVQHLEPTHESILVDLLQKVTHIPIHEITNNVRVEPNQIYIIPSNKILTAADGVLQLSPRPPRNERTCPLTYSLRRWLRYIKAMLLASFYQAGHGWNPGIESH